MWLAEGQPGTQWERGGYYEKKKLASSSPHAHDDELARRLWEASDQMVA